MLLGHSLGGLFLQQYCRDFPENILGLVVLDPATTEEDRFKKELTAKQLQQSGIDKMRNIKQGLFFGRLRMIGLFRSLLKKSIPFYYYKDYDKASEEDTLNHFTQYATYRAMKDEYEYFKDQNTVLTELTANAFPNIPVTLILHDTAVMTDEIVNFGGLTQAEAEKIDLLWKDIMENHYSKLSQQYTVKTSKNSGHYIHLTDFGTVMSSIDEMIMAV